MSMLQLLGGVAAAGVVAAGATAFTASGVTSTVTSAGSFMGGFVTQSVTGTVVDTVTYGYADGAAKTQVHTIALHFADTNSVGAAVTLSTTGSGAAQPTWTCGAVSGQASTCTASADFTLSAVNTITDMAIKVV
jgi:hypothetical protein